VLDVAAKFPALAVQGVMMRKFGQEVIRATAGKKIHGTGAVPGGVNKNLSIAERDGCWEVDQMLAWARGALAIARDYTMDHLVELIPFGSFDSNHLSIVRASDGALDLYDGVLRAVDKDGARSGRRGLPALPRGRERGSAALVVHEVPVPQAARARERLVPRGAAGAHEHLLFHPTPEAEAAAQGIPRLTKGRPTTSPCATTGRG
jgi:hypothetical protein